MTRADPPDTTSASPRRPVGDEGVPGVLRLLVAFHEAHVLGAGTSVLRTVDELVMYGWTVSGWVPGRGQLLSLAQECLAQVECAERPIAVSRRGWREPPGARARARRTPDYVRSLREALLRLRPTVVHANTLLSLPEAAIARSCGIPVVLQVHELPPPGAKRTATVRVAARVADVLVGVSEAVTSMLRPHAGSTPVLTVRNGVPQGWMSTRTANRDERFTIGTIGTVSRTKGTDVFLRAAAIALEQRPGLRFEHVGASALHRDPGLDEEIDQLLAGLPSDAVRILGTRPAESVLPAWDTFVLTSRSEAFPLVTLEAMAAGLPVVATAVGGVPEQIRHRESGILVRPDDPAELAAWLVRLHDDAELRQRLGAEAARRARDEFTIAAQAAGLHRAYLTALSLRYGPPVVRRALRALA